ncbi:UPF0481 protein At3g47200-like [Nicotiana tabacum]|uniref:UPF0481 protein At3g47200-like n=1 Tax=Nicotiana tabacum TaxID=4097 RepID=A0A1S3ZH32_TOBAC|nr:PREDICTED: UPF0481 protein At3g47200-like [Nicotiana tabacum]
MAHSIEITQIDHRTPLLRQATKDEREDGRKDDYLIEIKERLKLQRDKSLNQIFDERFEDLDNSSIKSTTIFKVNAAIRESNPDAYTPKMISIGPYHKKNQELHSMEKYKLLCLRRFLQRKEGLDVESCIGQLEELKDEAIKCYDDIDSDIVGKFSEMLLLDGCFVVEFIRDPLIINAHWMVSQVCRDLLLLENQLPFFVLAKLHDMTKRPEDLEPDFIRMVKSTLCYISPSKIPMLKSEIDGDEEKFDHLLHVVHMFCRLSEMTKTSQISNSSIRKECCNIKRFLGKILRLFRSKEISTSNIWQSWQAPTATELYEAGASFIKLGSFEADLMDRTTMFDIKFENAAIQIPCFVVGDSTEAFLRNLIAYEQHSTNLYPKCFLDYVDIMGQLIKSRKDVNLLRQNGIILNGLADDGEVANMFKKLGEGIVVVADSTYYDEASIKMSQHCKKPWNQIMANLRQNYFSSPWAGASTVAAVILLILTAMQTVLAFRDGIK